jgi:hypothetical protein
MTTTTTMTTTNGHEEGHGEGHGQGYVGFNINMLLPSILSSFSLSPCHFHWEGVAFVCLPPHHHQLIVVYEGAGRARAMMLSSLFFA